MRQQLSKLLKTSFWIGLSLFIFATPLHAAKVIKVKGKKVYLALSKSETMNKGDKVLITAGRKKAGLAIVRVVKGRKAIALLRKGKARRGFMAKNMSKSSSAAAPMQAKNESSKKSSEKKYERNKKWTFGAIGGFNMVTMNVDLGSETVAATGINFSAKGYAQYHWKPSISLMAVMGYEGFSSSATASSTVCDSNTSTDCTTNIQFLASEAWGQYYLTRGQRAYWLGGGMAFNFPLSKSSTSLNESDIGLTNFYLIGGGVDWGRIPIWFEYAIMPATETVNANYFSIKAGYSF
jgi:hypothetical protein